MQTPTRYAIQVFRAICGRSLEDPAVPITAKNLAAELGTVSDTGQTIGVTSALKYSPVWRGAMLISQSVMKLPIFIYRRVDEGKERAVEHPSYYLVRYEPRAEQSIEDLKLTVTLHAIMKGNGYVYIDRLKNGDASEMWMLDPDRVTPTRVDGKLWYAYQMDVGELRKLPASDVIHIHGPSWDGLSGMGVVQYGLNSIGMGMAAQKFTNKFFANSARPSVILEHPAIIDEGVAKRLKEQWTALHSGLDNSHKTAVLEQGMKANLVSSNARDAQLIETLQFSIRDIANWFGCPPHKLGDNSRTAYNSIEAENQAFIDECLDAWLVPWESEIRMKLLTEEQKRRDTHTVEFLRQALVRGDMKARYYAYKIATGGRAFMSPDEVRSRENLNEMGGDAGELRDPANNFPTDPTDDDEGKGDTGNRAAKPPPENMAEIQAAAKAALHDAVTRMRKRFRVHLDKKTRNGTEVVDAGRQVWSEHSQLMTEALGPCARLVAQIEKRKQSDVIDECRAVITAA